ncbi:MBL fold metallo-hydrolase [Streptomyces sp. NPDC048638]|uniref:MBL fold metallo-hydrolase n=1 Tax=Streptomyces sp. NPDC048638 TaxID=3365580 RepID=UPI00371DBD9B
MPNSLQLATEKPHLAELSPGRAYAYLQPRGGWCVSNAGVLIGDDSVLLIDCTATEASARRLQEHVASITPKPVKSVIFTHHHGDHHYGASAFAPAATLISQRNTRDIMLRDGTDLLTLWPDAGWGEVQLSPPAITFEERLTLHVGDMEAELIHLGPAHTNGDAAVWLPEQRILYAGDLTFADATPFILMGSVAGALQVLRQLKDLDPEIVVSGHGPVRGPEVLDTNIAYLQWLHELAHEGLHAGRTPLETALRADLGPFQQLAEAERLVGNLHRAYAELQSDTFQELPVPAILADMIAFNGGRPIPCTV